MIYFKKFQASLLNLNDHNEDYIIHHYKQKLLNP